MIPIKVENKNKTIVKTEKKEIPLPMQKQIHIPSPEENYTKILMNKNIIIIHYRYYVDLNATIRSIQEQQIKDIGILFIGNNLPSQSVKGIQSFFKGFKDISIVLNDKSESELFIRAFSFCKNNESIFYFINAGDILLTKTALFEIERLHQQYDVVWTQHEVNDKIQTAGNSGQSLIQNPRNEKFVFGHLRSCKNYLCQRIGLDYLRDFEGKYFEHATDIAIMFCVLEMAGAKRCCYYNQVLYLKNPLTKELQNKRNEDELKIRSLPREQILPHIAMYGKNISKDEFNKFCHFLNRLHKTQATVFTNKLNVPKEEFDKVAPTGLTIQSIGSDTTEIINKFDVIMAVNKGFEDKFKIPILTDNTINIPRNENVYSINNFHWFHNMIYHLINPVEIKESLLDMSSSVDIVPEELKIEGKANNDLAIIIDAREKEESLKFTLESLYTQHEPPDMVYILTENEKIVKEVEDNKERYAFPTEPAPSLFALNHIIKDIKEEKVLILKSGVILNQESIVNHKKHTNDSQCYFEKSIKIPNMTGLEFVILSGFDNIAYRLHIDNVPFDKKEINNNLSIPTKLLQLQKFDEIFENISNKNTIDHKIIYEINN